MAQAVCARTYAWKQMQGEGVSGYPADVDDSVSYQVYGNIQPQESTSEAVEETKGLILTREGEPIEAYYFSTSAGATSTDEIWGAEEAAPYLKSVVCEFDENSPWREESNHSLGESSAESFRKNRDTGETAFSGGGKEK